MDKTFNVSFSVQKNPGVYALLLGSGISRAAGIPTGWEIVQDLMRQLKAIGAGEPHEDMGYDELLGALGKTEAERNAILRSYFEPTEAQREQSLKIPSQAHRSIAKLIKSGYIKVVVTTNFDRLLEIALADEGITPDVIRSEAMIQGTPPLRHSSITIIQVNGDYRDIRTLNTAKELGIYTVEKNAYLDSIFAEYGLIVCGWSAKWDSALRDAIFRNPQRWYSTYWIEPNKISDEANDLIHVRRAEIIQRSADGFFMDLLGQVESLAKLNREHPLTVAIAVERVKKALVNDSYEIDFQDLLAGEVEQAYQKLSLLNDEHLPQPRTSDSVTNFIKSFIDKPFATSEIILNMITAMCWYGKNRYSSILVETMKRLASPKNFQDELNGSRKMAPLLLLYAGGIAAVYKGNWSYLRSLTIDVQLISQYTSKRINLMEQINKRKAFTIEFTDTSESDPFTYYLQMALRPLFVNYIQIDNEFKDLVDLFEMILALICLTTTNRWMSHNAALRDYADEKRTAQIETFWTQGAKLGKDWGFLKEIFGGNRIELEEALGKYREAAIKSQIWEPKHHIPDYKTIYTRDFV